MVCALEKEYREEDEGFDAKNTQPRMRLGRCFRIRDSTKLRRPPVFELVAAICHRHIAFKWVRIPPESDAKKRPTAKRSGKKSRMRDSTKLRRPPVFELVAAICHRHIAFKSVRIPPESDAKKRPTAYAVRRFLAEDEGFEPPRTESESGVLPLH